MTDVATWTSVSDLDDARLEILTSRAQHNYDVERRSGSPDPTRVTLISNQLDHLRAERDRRRAGGALRRPSLAGVAERAPRPRPDGRRPVALIAAAGDGRPLDATELAQRMHDSVRYLADRAPRVLVASIGVPTIGKLGDDPSKNVRRVREFVTNAPTAQALVASGGWCGPSTPIFNVFDVGPDSAGLIDLPALTGRAGAGVMVPAFYGFGDVAGALWTWTEANDIAAAESGGPTKPCLKIPCPTFTECRLEAEGLCVTHGNLSDRAWPELTRQFIGVVVGSHQHRVSASKIAKIVADAEAVTVDASMLDSDAAGDLLNVIAFAAASLRSKYRLAPTRSLDVLLPDWAIEVMRACVAMRQGVDFMSVSDAQVVGWLTSRGVRPQLVSDYQPLGTDGTPATRWPASMDFLIWPSGGYVSVEGGRIDLGVVRDSTLNETNDFTAAWSEQFFQVCRVGPPARKYQVELQVDGVTGCCAPAA